MRYTYKHKPYWVKKEKHRRLFREDEIVRALLNHPFIKRTRGYARFTRDKLEEYDGDFGQWMDSCVWSEIYVIHKELQDADHDECIDCLKEMYNVKPLVETDRAYYAAPRLELRSNINVMEHFERQEIAVVLYEDAEYYVKVHEWHDSSIRLRIDREWYSLCLKRGCECPWAVRWSKILKREITPHILPQQLQMDIKSYCRHSLPSDISKIICKMVMELNMCNKLRKEIKRRVRRFNHRA